MTAAAAAPADARICRTTSGFSLAALPFVGSREGAAR
jgi:hypothetical protein